VNALSGDAPLFAEVDGKYGVFTLRELYELHNQGRAIKVPALLNERGEKGWVDVEDVVSCEKQSLKRITLATTRLYVEASKNAIIPAFSSRLFSGREKRINLKFKPVNELTFANDPTFSDTLLTAIRIPLNIPIGTQNDWEYGFCLGFFISEGNFEYRRRSFTKRSLAILNGFARKMEMSLEDYLKFTTEILRVDITVGQQDFERKYVDILLKHFKFAKPNIRKSDNSIMLYSSDKKFIHLIKDYIDGFNAHTKRLKNEAYNRSFKFLEGIMDGYLSGDAHYNIENNHFDVGMTENYLLYNDLIFLAKILGYDVHLNKDIFVKNFKTGKIYHVLRLKVFKQFKRNSALGFVKEHIKTVEDAGVKESFNLVLKPLYPKDNKRSFFNNLYFTAYGFLVSDAIKT